jgi:hypothetical protein
MQVTTPPAQNQLPALDNRKTSATRLMGLLMIVIGLAGIWYNWHLAVAQGHFYIKLCVLGPLGLFGGVLVCIRPDWAGPWRSENSRDQKTALISVAAVIFIASGIEMYLLDHIHSFRSLMTLAPVLAIPSKAATNELSFLGRKYYLASFNDKPNATWEFITSDETIGDWKTLVTVIERRDARTREDLDRLAEGIKSTYESHGSRILAARTMRQESGAVVNYLVAAFEEPRHHRFELNFAKFALGPTNAIIMIYGVRLSDPVDYAAKAKEFLDRNSSEVGRALADAALPDVSQLPRRRY